QFGRLDKYDFSQLRLVLFAGEVFPVRHLRALSKLLPNPTYFNLYGPTETNVCTYYRIPTPVPDERTSPYPIGAVCDHFKSKVIDDLGRDVPAGQDGELCISGRGVMRGYWDLPERTQQAFLVDGAGTQWYKTGDLVVQDVEGTYSYRGRRD